MDPDRDRGRVWDRDRDRGIDRDRDMVSSSVVPTAVILTKTEMSTMLGSSTVASPHTQRQRDRDRG